MMMQGYLGMFRLKFGILNVKREFIGISLLVVPWCPSDDLSTWRRIDVKQFAIKRAFYAAESVIEDSNVNVKVSFAGFIIV